MNPWESSGHLQPRNVFPPPPAPRTSPDHPSPFGVVFPSQLEVLSSGLCPAELGWGCSGPQATCTRTTSVLLTAGCSPIMQSRMRHLHFGASRLMSKAIRVHKQAKEPCKGRRDSLWVHGKIQMEGITLPPPSFTMQITCHFSMKIYLPSEKIQPVGHIIKKKSLKTKPKSIRRERTGEAEMPQPGQSTPGLSWCCRLCPGPPALLTHTANPWYSGMLACAEKHTEIVSLTFLIIPTASLRNWNSFPQIFQILWTYINNKRHSFLMVLTGAWLSMTPLFYHCNNAELSVVM